MRLESGLTFRSKQSAVWPADPHGRRGGCKLAGRLAICPDFTSCSDPQCFRSKIDAHVAKTLESKPTLVQISYSSRLPCNGHRSGLLVVQSVFESIHISRLTGTYPETHNSDRSTPLQAAANNRVEFGPSVAACLSSSGDPPASAWLSCQISECTLELNFRLRFPARTGRTTIRVAAASARPHGLNRGIGSQGQAKRRALSSYGNILAERNENEHDAICKDRKNCSQSCSESACPREFAEHGCEHTGTGCREALSDDAPTFAVFNGPGCGNRAGAKRRSGGNFKGCVCFGADAQRLGNGGPRYEWFCVHGGAVMDG